MRNTYISQCFIGKCFNFQVVLPRLKNKIIYLPVFMIMCMHHTFISLGIQVITATALTESEIIPLS